MPRIELNNFICKLCKTKHNDDNQYDLDKIINCKEQMKCNVCGCSGAAEYITGRHKKTHIHRFGKRWIKGTAEEKNKPKIQQNQKPKEKPVDIRKLLTIYFD